MNLSTSTLEHVGTDLEIRLDEIWHAEIPCEGNNHLAGLWGHVPAESAYYRVWDACGCPPVLICKAWVDYALAHLLSYFCGARHSCRVDEIRFEQI